MAPWRAATASGPSCQRVPLASSRKRPTRSEAVMSSLQATVISGLFELPGHVFDEARLAATGRALEHHGHAHRIGRLVQLDLVGHRAVVGFFADAVGVEVVAHVFLRISAFGGLFGLHRAGRGERLRSCPPLACGRLRLHFTAPLTPTHARRIQKASSQPSRQPERVLQPRAPRNRLRQAASAAPWGVTRAGGAGGYTVFPRKITIEVPCDWLKLL